MNNNETETIYGYPIKDLILFADMCRKNHIDEIDLREAAGNIKYAYAAVRQEFDNAICEVINKKNEEIELVSNHEPFHIILPRNCDLDKCSKVKVRGRDFVELIHGEWINKYPLSTCSVCSATMILNDYSNFCPCCGAKMDGKEQRDE